MFLDRPCRAFFIGGCLPRALPWAKLDRPFGAFDAEFSYLELLRHHTPTLRNAPWNGNLLTIMSKLHKDRDILRALAGEVATIAALPIQEEKRRLWRALNGLRPERPMVIVDQVPWHELDVPALECEDAECRVYEQHFRRTLYRWKHFAGDWTVEPYVEVFKGLHNTGFGVAMNVELASTDPKSDVYGQHYVNQFQTDADLDKIKMPILTYDITETERRAAKAHELFDGVLEARLVGFEPCYMSFWDPISTWMNVEEALYAIIDRPEYVHEMLERMTRGYLSMLDQAEALNVLRKPQPWIHCTGGFTDELPQPDSDPEHPRTRDLWCMGLAQMFSTVSPEIFAEFEVAYFKRLAARFGLVYYGCCDPLDDRIAQVREIPNVRKISMSPWTNQVRGAAAIGGDFVFSRKPSPALLAGDTLNEERIRTDLAETVRICREHGCPCELVLKDVSTVRYEPQRLERWTRIAMEVVGGS